MSKFQRLFLLFAVIATSAFFSISTSHAVEYAIGDTGPAGGKIFITPSTAGNTTGKYFEAAPENVSASSYLWCNLGNQTIPATFFTAIGTGITNTSAMIAYGCISGAAYEATQYRLNGFNDWYLPSSDEVGQLYSTKSATGLFDGSPALDVSGQFWTSSGIDFRLSYSYLILSFRGSQTELNLESMVRVRAVRSFTPGKSASEIAAEEAAVSAAKAAAEEAARKAAEEARAARIIAAKATLTNSLESKSEFTTQMMLEADAGVTRISSIQAIFAELKAIQAVNKGSLSASEQQALRIKVGFKYQTMEKITGGNPVNIYARTLVSTGLLGASTPQKSRIFSLIKALPTQSRDSMEKINIFIAQEVALVQARRERLAARLAK